MVGPPRGPADTERTRTLWFALLLTLANGFLDAHTYLTRGGVFANVQTANVIFSAIDLSDQQWVAALAHVWPLLAFNAGVSLASFIKSGRVEPILPHSPRWTMGVQAIVLAIIGFVPSSVPHSYVTVPISFLAAMQIGLFRNIGDLAYLPVATTGNLMRLVESGYDGFVEKQADSRKAFGIYGALIVAFACGALIGAISESRGDRRLQPSGESGLPPRSGGSCRCPPVVFFSGLDGSFVQRRETHRREESEAE